MKRIYNTIIFLAITIVMAGSYSSCSKEKVPNGGEPRIRYIRITDPLSADSLLIGAAQGNLIAIMGENLQNTQQIWFNDQQAVLTPTYITNTTVLVNVPSQIPLDITNILRMTFANGYILEHEFEVQISEPFIYGMNCEYIAAGEIATIRGSYFYEPLTVTFTGGVEGELISIADNANAIQVRVPEGAQPGPITVTTNFGETPSDFWFRDNRNIFISSDPFTGWWNASFVVSNPGSNDPVAINGNYIRVQQAISAWQWLEVAGGPPDAMGDISKNIPDEAILRPADYYLKFEVNTLKPYNGNMLKINVGLANDFNNDQYQWAPPYDTQGQWQTVTIPFEEIMESYEESGSNISINPDGYYTRLLFHGPGDLDCDISFDNFRVVPKVIKR